MMVKCDKYMCIYWERTGSYDEETGCCTSAAVTRGGVEYCSYDDELCPACTDLRRQLKAATDENEVWRWRWIHIKVDYRAYDSVYITNAEKDHPLPETALAQTGGTAPEEE